MVDKSSMTSNPLYRRHFFCFAVFLFCYFILPVIGSPILRFEALALEVPQLKYHVNDYANMMSPETRSKIESDLKAFEQSDSTQVVILTIQSLEGEDLEGYSIKVAEAWKIGQKGKDNGVILLVANKERKIRIEVGRGLEGKLTDLAAIQGRGLRWRIYCRYPGPHRRDAGRIQGRRKTYLFEERPRYAASRPFHIRRHRTSRT